MPIPYMQEVWKNATRVRQHNGARFTGSFARSVEAWRTALAGHLRASHAGGPALRTCNACLELSVKAELPAPGSQ